MEENLIVRLAGSNRLDDTIANLADEFGIPQGSSSGGDYRLPLAKEQVAIALMSVPTVFRPGEPLPDKMANITPAQREVLGNFCAYYPPGNIHDFLPLVRRAVALYAAHETK